MEIIIIIIMIITYYYMFNIGELIIKWKNIGREDNAQ